MGRLVIDSLRNIFRSKTCGSQCGTNGYHIKNRVFITGCSDSAMDTLLGPSGGSRTHGLMDPNHARYQLRYTRKQLIYYKRNFIRCQDIRQKNLAQKIKEFFGIQK